jgi:hypothetical protein
VNKRCSAISTNFDKLNNQNKMMRFRTTIRTLHTPTTPRETNENRDAHRDGTGISFSHRRGFETAKNTRVGGGLNDDRSIGLKTNNADSDRIARRRPNGRTDGRTRVQTIHLRRRFIVDCVRSKRETETQDARSRNANEETERSGVGSNSGARGRRRKGCRTTRDDAR